jgi:hypothetical protein
VQRVLHLQPRRMQRSAPSHMRMAAAGCAWQPLWCGICFSFGVLVLRQTLYCRVQVSSACGLQSEVAACDS